MDDQGGSGSPEAAWYADPFGRHQVRYWDGLAWTDSVADNDQESTDPLLELPLQWTGQLSGTCDNCHAPTSSGTRFVYYAGVSHAVETLQEKVTSWRVDQRSSVLLCEACTKGKVADVLIGMKVGRNGLGSTHSWREKEFVQAFGPYYLGKNPGYVRPGDLGRDDLARPESADDATLVMSWTGVVFPNGSATPLIVAVDDVYDGFGAMGKDFTARVRVPAGVHKVSFGLRQTLFPFTDEIVAFDPGATYHMDLRWSTRGRFSSEIKRTS